MWSPTWRAQQRKKFVQLPSKSANESRTHAVCLADVREDDERVQFDIKNLFYNEYWVKIYHKFLGYIGDEVSERLFEETAISIAKLEASIATVMECFAEQRLEACSDETYTWMCSMQI